MAQHKLYSRDIVPKKPIEIANDEIVNLKKVILMLRKDIEFLKLSVSPLLERELEIKKREELLDKDMVIENNSWWWN
tara:strand:+ start:509 stop:739 length:231 start_codon:yes stop_codon:yes gene_type:complete